MISHLGGRCGPLRGKSRDTATRSALLYDATSNNVTKLRAGLTSYCKSDDLFVIR